MRSLFVVSESGFGTELVSLATEWGPDVEGVRFVPEGGHGSTPVFIVNEWRPGMARVFPSEGRQFVPPHLLGIPMEPVPPNLDLLSPDDHLHLGEMNRLWERLGSGDNPNPADLQAALDYALGIIDRSWPEPIWSEEIMHKACFACFGLMQFGDPESVALPLKAICQKILDRRWLHGGPAGYFDAETAQEALRVLPIAESAART